MSNLNPSWMSCRQSTARSSNLQMLPQFHPPGDVQIFPLESRPPTLPPRNSQSRTCLMAVGVVLCVFGSYSMLNAAAEPFVRHSSRFASGVKAAVSGAIAHANAEAEQHASRHYQARERYMARRRASVNEASSPPSTQPSKATLLLRLAALRAEDAPAIDERAVEQLFPLWLSEHSSRWNNDVVMRDLVLAVSQIAHTLSIDNPGAGEAPT